MVGPPPTSLWSAVCPPRSLTSTLTAFSGRYRTSSRRSVENRENKDTEYPRFFPQVYIELQVDYDEDSLEVVRNGTRLALLNWRLKRPLSSESVGSPMDKRHCQVSGFINSQRQSLSEVSHKVGQILLP